MALTGTLALKTVTKSFLTTKTVWTELLFSIEGGVLEWEDAKGREQWLALSGCLVDFDVPIFTLTSASPKAELVLRASDPKDAKADTIADLLWDTALITSGFNVENTMAFAKSITTLMTDSVGGGGDAKE